MKCIKSFAIVCVLVLSLVLLCGCGGEGGGGGGGVTPPASKTIEEVKADVLKTFTEYGAAEHGAFKLNIKNGDKESTVDMIYNYDVNKIGVLSLKAVLTNANGTMSVYVTDEEAYTDRYGESKNIIEMKDDQGEQIAMEYSFDQFNEYLILMLNNSFFANSTIDSFENNVAKVTLNIGTYNIDNEEESEVLTTIFDGIKEKDSVSLEVTYAETAVTNIKVTIVGENTSIIELQLLGTSAGDIAIEFPDFSDYTKQK